MCKVHHVLILSMHAVSYPPLATLLYFCHEFSLQMEITGNQNGEMLLIGYLSKRAKQPDDQDKILFDGTFESFRFMNIIKSPA